MINLKSLKNQKITNIVMLRIEKFEMEKNLKNIN
jgi:hypothetical protein